MRWYLSPILCLCFILPLQAQSLDFPTVDALQQLTIPAHDPLDLVRRLRGLDVQFTPPTSAPQWTVGDRRFFTVANDRIIGEELIEAELKAVSDHALLWVDTRATLDHATAGLFVQAVDSAIIQQVQALWGVVEPAGVDGDTRLYILMVTGLNEAIGGYFSNVNTFPRSVLPNSNQHEMMIVNLSAFGGDNILSPRLLTIIAHEYQHVLRHFIDNDEETWVDEGFSNYTEHHLGWDGIRSQVVSFLHDPALQVNQWVADSGRYARYGAVFLLVNYFAERYGTDTLREWSNEPLDGWRGLDAVLERIAGVSADVFFADWVVANYVLNTDSDYGYRTLWYNLPSVRPVASINAFPSSHKRQIPQYSADYYTAFDVGGAFQLTFTQPETVGLIPASVFEGGQMAYAVPADYADATLTRNVDLTGVTSATLQFRTWYDLEENWDYAYVMVSTDAGATWDSVPATTTRDSNPYNRAYGVGFTGQSFGWVEETVSLDAYVGREILLRFEVITDAASLRHSIAVDAIRLDAVGYIDGFENGFGAWEARGWIVTDNRLPQSAWVQVIHLQRDTVQQIDRYRTDSPSQTWTITPALDADMLVIVVSPFAPQTMLGADYTLAWVNGD